MQRLIRFCTICLNYWKIRIEWNSRKSPFRTIFPAYTQTIDLPVLQVPSRKQAYIILTPLNPTFIQWNYFFLFLLKNIDCGYSLEPPSEAVLTSTNNLCFDQKYEKYPNFYLKIFIFCRLKCSVYLNRHVFLMFDFQRKLLNKFVTCDLMVGAWLYITKTRLFKYIENFTSKN